MTAPVDRELYQEVLLQYSKRPINFGPMEHATHHADGHNALCGDEVSVALQVEDGKVVDAKFTGSACTICTASSCIMTDAVKGKSREEAEELAEKFRELAKTGITSGDFSRKIQILAGVHQFPQRVKCAVLPWETMLSAIEQKVE